MSQLRLGISACLLGENARDNGQHKRDPFLVDTLGEWCRHPHPTELKLRHHT